jgi:hypothetical protein
MILAAYGLRQIGEDGMGRLFTRMIVMLSAAALVLPAKAQQQGSTITLFCNGTSKLTATAAADFKPDPITKLGIIVNFANRTVTFSDYVTPITGVNATLISFSGRQTLPALGPKGPQFTIDGSIDRVTGHSEIDWWYEVAGNNSHWEWSAARRRGCFEGLFGDPTCYAMMDRGEIDAVIGFGCSAADS